MWVQALVRAFWPFASILCVGVGLALLGVFDGLSVDAIWFVGLGILSACGVGFVYGCLRFVRPSLMMAIEQLDQTHRHHPLSVLLEQDFARSQMGADPQVAYLWQQHKDRMQQDAATLRPIMPRIDISDQDTFGLHYSALLVLVLGVLFGSIDRISSVGSIDQGAPDIAGVVPWEIWITPPEYSKRPTLYLNDLRDRDRLGVLPHSLVQIRLYGQPGDYLVEETVSERTQDAPTASASVQEFRIETQGTLAVSGDNGARWTISLDQDAAPSVTINGGFETEFFGQSQLSFTAQDDFQVNDVGAQVMLDLDRVEREFGLSAAPDLDQSKAFDLPLPITGRSQAFDEIWTEDFSKEPMLHLPIVVTLSATDALGQIGHAVLTDVVLPGRKFFDPVAASLIEMRRDLLWSLENGDRVSRMLRAVSYAPAGAFRSETDYLRLRTILRQLEMYQARDLLRAKRAELADALWDLALSIEEGDVNDALERMRQAQERLSQAMRDGASQPEIEKLMQELRQANENYIRQLRQQAERDQTRKNQDLAQNSPQDQMQMNQSDLDKMMDRIQELMEQGRMAEAQQALEELQRMMENMQVAQGENGEGGQSDALDQLSQTLRDQQNLSDDAFRQLQQSQPQDGENGNQTSPDLADRQGQLRQQLEQDRQSLPDVEGDLGSRAERSFEQAERAMRQAEDALRQGDLDGAIDKQAQAMDALRNGINEMDRAMAEAQNPEQGQGMAQDQDGENAKDPLGRPQGRDGNAGTAEAGKTTEDVARQAEALLDEIRRRAGEIERPDPERNYLKRLLDLF